MRFLYSVKGCSHCDLREGCDLKNHRANLGEVCRAHGRFWSMCLDFMRIVRD